MPHRSVPPANRRFGKAMRQEMTEAEARLWRWLRKPGIPGLRFRRQAPIGPYIVDFFCPQRRQIVEEHDGIAAAVRREYNIKLWSRTTLRRGGRKTWMAGTSPAMTGGCAEESRVQ